ncbi:acyl CoA carboxylase subunit alpha [Legionella geestiana]|uniref:Biotin carboxylase n=1 Tax=Legionella geestiana TaxID=45065 RepID=A0A0W0TZ09_9GAMM|nr:acetyl-CoA carboxylase biotin carboxylase subunit [Legionella geestiana]KTD00636.1 acyl CoA carboxylase subunit alpha [Legionella geestiana]QBS11749.1 acetyl-CoA carboxylase biotin carboxylase subunit [Legionella geestiana]QDQ40639.1 acetyl-CoA carboxylase biotin carboxylase subunit [Legionella geestiana]STX53560.1 acyl CoA carboxylase subunit alpha [Legionella geestiana]
MFKRVLIANRGEIACRIIKTLRRLGIESVAVYSTADADSEHVRLADEAFCIGEPRALSSYLNIDVLVETAVKARVCAIHPGYGFLSENPRFVKAVTEKGIVFIGPSVAAMEAMGSKQTAKQILEGTGVPLTPGYHGKNQEDATLFEAARNIGFPVLLKAAAGGGGKGMRAVHAPEEFSAALEGARRESRAAFGDDTMLIEKLIQNPRHVEIQIMADNHGNVVHLFERDCSIQRRHQKIIEEAPAPGLPDALREGLAKAACTVARTIDYRGAGTVEFLVDADFGFYFMEVNTRLQVEHPVTEMITGFDLVEWQLRIAANEPLPATQDAIRAHGHAVECRICAEDPRENFLPSTGVVHFLKIPEGTGIRLDSGIVKGSTISQYYDPMFAKLIAHGRNREEAIARLTRALADFHVGGVRTNIAFVERILKHPVFANAQHDTHFLSENTVSLEAPNTNTLLFATATADYLQLQSGLSPLAQSGFGWHMGRHRRWPARYQLADGIYEVQITPQSPDTLVLETTESRHVLKGLLKSDILYLDVDGERIKLPFERHAHQWTFYTPDGPGTTSRAQWASAEQEAAEAELTAPMPSTVVAILKNIGDTVSKGERLMVLEAMKMEHTLYAPRGGRVTAIYFAVGAQVSEGVELLALEEAADDSLEG